MNNILKSLILAAALSLPLAGTAIANDDAAEPMDEYSDSYNPCDDSGGAANNPCSPEESADEEQEYPEEEMETPDEEAQPEVLN